MKQPREREREISFGKKCKNEGVRAGFGVLGTLWASP